MNLIFNNRLIKVKQKDISDCGAACLASISQYYRLKIPISKIRQFAGTDGRGTNVLGMLEAAEKMGFSAKGVKGDVDALSQVPLPSIAHVVINKKLHHYVVIISVKNSNIKIMDPGDGEIHRTTITEFKKIWSGVLILMIPSDHFHPGNNKVSVYQRFFYLLKPHKSILLQSLFGALVTTILGLSTSIYLQKIVDHVLINNNTNLLTLLSLLMIIILFIQVFLNISKDIFVLKTGQKIDAQLILGYYNHLLKLPQRFFDTMQVGEILSRINDAAKIRMFINEVIINLIVSILIITFSFTLMFIYSFKLALSIIFAIPLYLLIYLITNKINKKRERDLMESAAEFENQLVESISSIRTIKQFGLGDYAKFKTENSFVSLLSSIYKSSLNTIFSINSSNLITRLTTILLLWIGSNYVIKNEITPGVLLSFYAIIGYFTEPLKSLISANKSIQNAVIAADRLFEIVDLEHENIQNKIDLIDYNFEYIIFDNVSFTYGTRIKVFDNFNMKINKGAVTAIIGESGSGKTTIASLIMNLYQLKSGNIYIGKYNIKYLSKSNLLKFVGSVPQNLCLFTGSILENIAMGDYNPNFDRIFNICSMLGIKKYIEDLPNGFNTFIGKNGIKLSEGQKQRLIIARTIYINPMIFILDEATSFLDSESEQFVLNTIEHLKKSGKTIILIAHRLSTVVNADIIIHLSNGEIIEQGSHLELYNKKGKYFQLWQKQFPIKTNHS